MTRSRTGFPICSVYATAAQLPSCLHHFPGIFANLRNEQKLGQVPFFLHTLIVLSHSELHNRFAGPSLGPLDCQHCV